MRRWWGLDLLGGGLGCLVLLFRVCLGGFALLFQLVLGPGLGVG